jgi:hypothetical protein
MARDKNKQKPLSSSVSYFERVIGNHTAVASIKEVSENIYEIERVFPRTPVRILVADIYVVSEADIIEIVSEHHNLDCVLLIGFYNRTSLAAKERAKSENIGLFDMKEFFGALNFVGEKFINYEPKKQNP